MRRLLAAADYWADDSLLDVYGHFLGLALGLVPQDLRALVDDQVLAERAALLEPDHAARLRIYREAVTSCEPLERTLARVEDLRAPPAHISANAWEAWAEARRRARAASSTDKTGVSRPGDTGDGSGAAAIAAPARSSSSTPG